MPLEFLFCCDNTRHRKKKVCVVPANSRVLGNKTFRQEAPINQTGALSRDRYAFGPTQRYAHRRPVYCLDVLKSLPHVILNIYRDAHPAKA